MDVVDWTFNICQRTTMNSCWVRVCSCADICFHLYQRAAEKLDMDDPSLNWSKDPRTSPENLKLYETDCPN